MVAKGFIEYIDTEEEETTMISMSINVHLSHSVCVDDLFDMRKSILCSESLAGAKAMPA